MTLNLMVMKYVGDYLKNNLVHEDSGNKFQLEKLFVWCISIKRIKRFDQKIFNLHLMEQ